MVRGVEIASDVADLPRTVVTRQVTNGVAVRMAILFLLLGGELPGRRRCRPLPDVTLVIRGGTVVEPGGLGPPRCRRAGGPVVARGRVHRRARRAPRCSTPPAAWSGPGLVDLHTHLRQPGREEAETVETGRPGGRARRVHRHRGHAEHGADHRLRRRGPRGARARPGGPAEVAVAGAITVGRAGERWPRWASWPPSASRLFTDDGAGRPGRRAHAAGPRLRQGPRGHAGPALRGRLPRRRRARCTRGAWSSRLGLPGMPAAAEEAMVARDLALVRLTGAPVHFLHLSTAGSVALVRRAKAEGLPVTAEAAPHHMLLTDAAVAGLRPGLQGQPAAAHRRRRGRRRGRAVRRHHRRRRHRPRPARPRGQGRALSTRRPPGMLGLQTALPIAWEVLSSALRPERLFALLSAQPAAIARLEGDGPAPRRPQCPGRTDRGRGDGQPVRLRPGRARLDGRPGRLASRSRNTPYAGRTFTGAVRHTSCGASRSSSTRWPSDDGAARDRGPRAGAAGDGRRRRSSRARPRAAPVPRDRPASSCSTPP